MMIDKNKSEGNGIKENDELNPSTTKEEETSLPESEDVSPEEKIKELEDQLLDSETPERCRVVAEAYFDLDRAVEELVGLYGSVSTE